MAKKQSKKQSKKSTKRAPKTVGVEDLAKGDRFATRRGDGFKVHEIEVVADDEFHGEPRKKYRLLVEDESERVYQVHYMDTDQVIKL